MKIKFSQVNIISKEICSLNFLLVVFLMLTLSVFSGKLWACHTIEEGTYPYKTVSITTTTVSYNLPTSITVPANTNVGGIIQEVTVETKGWPGDVNTEGACIQYVAFSPTPTESSFSSGVYETGITGVGYYIQTYNQAQSGTNTHYSYPRTYSYDASSLADLTDTYFGGTQTVIAKIIFVKTGATLGATANVTIPQLKWYLDDGRIVLNVPSQSTQIITRNPGCTSRSSSNYSVTLDKINANRIPNVGSTYGEKSLNLELTCNATTVVKMSMSATAASGLDSSGVAASTGTSSGVGIQILSGGNPFPLNAAATTVYTQGSSDGPVDIPLSVRYYKTGSISSGTVSAQINYTLTYE